MLDNVSEELLKTVKEDVFTKVSGNEKEYMLKKNMSSLPLFKATCSLLVSLLTLAPKSATLFDVLSAGCVKLRNFVVECL